ncbi:relaxase/mobilization nuclease domain-containing protein [Bifidobacterium moukalabense]|uniref:relaxase/mobilization nuclease domain-containing protein n=1 Tax=Bifidobacterium moukalabense TaxID=1333651 RepID=UPI0010F4A753|nr:relaxase/mobilization nuclease domain-containing protein [Bifidobacterium moukalabense]
MAVVKLGKPVKSNLGGPNGAMAYIIDPAKTDGGRLVGSNYERTGTDHDALAEPMLEDNRNSPQGIRRNSRLAYHIKMSFSPDDPVTPELVHALGMEFARKITGGEYRFVVATHTDRHHLHNHIMVCAASRYGKHLKAELPKDIIDQWRAACDEICKREGLNIIFNPVVEEQARRMRGTETASENNGTAPARDPGPAAETSGQGTEAPPRIARRNGDGEPLERRYGMSMEEIYTAAKGKGVKDRLRVLIDLTTAGAENFEDWKDMLDVQGVDVKVRGEHFTFTVKDTGFRIRDVRLGQAYDMTNIMAGLANTPIIPITFNRRLVARQTKKTITVWLPGTHRQRKITFDVRHLVDDGGSTLRAFMPRDRDQIILDRSNRYAGKAITHGLYQWFGEPTSRLEPLATPERLPLRYGVSPAQQRYYQAQARRLDRLGDEAKALNAAIRWTRLADGDSAKGLKMLRGKVRESHDELQSAVIALHDAIQQDDPDLVVEARGEMERREHACDRYERELAAIEREINATRGREQERNERRDQQQHKRGRSI